MTKLFYNKQTDYIDKLNVLGDDLNLVNLNPGSTVTLDCTDSRVFYIQLTNAVNCTITVGPPPEGFLYYSIRVFVQQTTSGSETITWSNAVLATSATLTTTANRIDMFEVVTFDGGTSWKVTKLAASWTL